ncbi:hypothetical protein Q005_03642 [Pseudomonas aeruginosa X24509]|nr:hypothetical protein Q005_03642 [Pseudomonas aeruginosa X24509]
MRFGIPSGIPSHPLVIFGIPKPFLEYPMCAQATRLSDLKVKAAKPQEKDYVLSDGDGLQMRVRSNGSKLWNFNYRHPVTKNRINMGLGTFPEVSLAQARKRTVEARQLLAHGIDPKEKRDAVQQAKKAATEHTFQNVATSWYELKRMRLHKPTPRTSGAPSRCTSSQTWAPLRSPPSTLPRSSTCSGHLKPRAAWKPLNG